MRNLLISCFLTVCCSIAHAGAYEDILSAAGNDDTATVTSLLQRGMDAVSYTHLTLPTNREV